MPRHIATKPRPSARAISLAEHLEELDDLDLDRKAMVHAASDPERERFDALGTEAKDKPIHHRPQAAGHNVLIVTIHRALKTNCALWVRQPRSRRSDHALSVFDHADVTRKVTKQNGPSEPCA